MYMLLWYACNAIGEQACIKRKYAVFPIPCPSILPQLSFGPLCHSLTIPPPPISSHFYLSRARPIISLVYANCFGWNMRFFPKWKHIPTLSARQHKHTTNSAVVSQNTDTWIQLIDSMSSPLSLFYLLAGSCVWVRVFFFFFFLVFEHKSDGIILWTEQFGIVCIGGLGLRNELMTPGFGVSERCVAFVKWSNQFETCSAQ